MVQTRHIRVFGGNEIAGVQTGKLMFCPPSIPRVSDKSVQERYTVAINQSIKLIPFSQLYH